MSQAGIISTEADPTLPTTFVEDFGVAVPAANTLNIVGGSSIQDNTNGIFTEGAGNTVTVFLSNRFDSAVSTTGDETKTLVSFDMGVNPNTFFFTFKIASFEATTPAGAGYNYFSAARTDGIAATVIEGGPVTGTIEDDELKPCDINVLAVGNNVQVRVTGVVGLTISWFLSGTYISAL
jgi:hypothetical protein